jgi:hypothetical protein
MGREGKFRTALVIFAVLAVLEWTTLSSETVKIVTGFDGKPLFDLSVRGIAMAVLGLFAFRTIIQNSRMKLDEMSDRSRDEDSARRS